MLGAAWGVGFPDRAAYPARTLVVISLTGLFFPHYPSLVFNSLLPVLLGELWTMG